MSFSRSDIRHTAPQRKRNSGNLRQRWLQGSPQRNFPFRQHATCPMRYATPRPSNILCISAVTFVKQTARHVDTGGGGVIGILRVYASPRQFLMREQRARKTRRRKVRAPAVIFCNDPHSLFTIVETYFFSLLRACEPRSLFLLLSL